MSRTDPLDSNYPLMIMLREKAPGTYSHSKAVAALLEAVAVATGMHEESLVMAGYYHDIGKTVAPHMFIENQAEGEDNHKGLPPEVSHRYITAHIGDTAQILVNDSNIPAEVVRWCTQHHGTCVAQYFYRKAKRTKNKPNKDTFRYSCTKPESLSAALVMICDILEAKCRALSQAGKLEDIGVLVEETIQELEQDEQLDDVELTFGRLRTIKNVLKKELAAQYHQRVDYDKAEEEEE